MCTGIRLIADNNAVIYGRTLEFAQNIDSDIIIVPRNYSFTGTTPFKGINGLTWKSRYAVVGCNALDLISIVDGINEMGLAGGLFYFSDYAEYQEVSQDQSSYSIASWELMTWILTSFSTVAQVKEALPTIKVSKAIFGPWNSIIPLHAVIHDATGQSIVIEYIREKLTVHDNTLGVITNAPTFDWHNTNLKNYCNLSPFNAKPMQLFGNTTIAPLGQGSGMLGLPGDFTSPSRFVRAVAFSQTVVDIKDEHTACDAVFHVLNLFNIPLGVIREKENNTIKYDYTQWTSASDLKNKCYYFHTYNNRQIQKINLMNMNLNAKEPVKIKM